MLVENAPGAIGLARSIPPRDGYTITRYRPRIEGLFARIERWTRASDGDTYWRSISKDNVTTFYGKTAESRIADPDDRSQIFSWLICQSQDDKGNVIVYSYAAEDSANIDLSQANERNRSATSRSANRYLKRVKYGNTQSLLIQPDVTQAVLAVRGRVRLRRGIFPGRRARRGRACFCVGDAGAQREPGRLGKTRFRITARVSRSAPIAFASACSCFIISRMSWACRTVLCARRNSPTRRIRSPR